METMTVMNPFVVGKYVSDRYFCDRESETAFVIKQVENGRNVALISPRRLGKTGLIQHCFHQEQVNDRFHTFFVDIYATTSLTEFVFSGSKRHIMSNMFNSSSKPFYQSAISMGLEPIPMATYTDFAVQQFEERGKQVERALVEQVYQLFDGCTWFVQMMMNELFALTATGELCDTSKLELARRNVIQTQENSYKDLLARLAPKQKLVLQAIAKERSARGVTSSAFIKKYNLPSASSVQSALKPLLNNDLVTQTSDTYRVYDYFFADWLANEY